MLTSMVMMLSTAKESYCEERLGEKASPLCFGENNLASYIT